MSAQLRMVARRSFGVPARALLNKDLMSALKSSGEGCERCRDIEKDVDPTHEGGEYVESASFPGTSVHKLDAHFRTHWKETYEFVLIPEGR